MPIVIMIGVSMRLVNAFSASSLPMVGLRMIYGVSYQVIGPGLDALNHHCQQTG